MTAGTTADEGLLPDVKVEKEKKAKKAKTPRVHRDRVLFIPREEVAANADTTKLYRVYVWDRVVRLTHWLIVLSVIVLALTGVYIGDPFLVSPGPAGERFVMANVKTVHFYGSIVFSLAVAARLLWMFIGSRHARWWNFVPVRPKRWRGIIPAIKFYAFIQDRPPHFVGHNPIAGLTYAGVFGLCVLMVLTGLGLYAIGGGVDSYMSSFAFLNVIVGGAQMSRWLHHVAMWVLIAFAVAHLYIAILVAVVEKNGTLDSIFSGFKWLPRGEDEE